MTSATTGKTSLGLLLVFLTATISGVATFVNFWAVQGTNSDAFLALRNALVVLFLVPLAFLVRPEARIPLRRRDWARLATIGLIGGAVPFLLFFRGLQLAGQAGAATASFGYRTLFLMATVLAVVVLKERIHGLKLLAAGLLLAGNVLLLSLTSPVWTDGTALVLIATAMWAGEYTLRALRDLPSRTVALGRMGFGSLYLFGYVAAAGQLGAIVGMALPEVQWMALSAILLTGFVSTWYAGLRHVDLSVATSVLVLGFPITWTLALFAGKMPIAIASAVGVVTIVFGVGLAVGLVALRDTWSTVARMVLARTRHPA